MKATSVVCFITLVALVACSGSCRHQPTVSTLYDTAHERERLYATTVRITVQCPDGSGGWGSGVAVSPRHVLTARHVVDGCDGEIWMLTATPYGRSITVEMVPDLISETTDAARLVVVGTSKPFMRYARAAALPVPDGAMVCASVFDPGFFLYQCGYLVGVFDSMMVLGFRIVGGNSGGPVFADGRLVGLVVARSIHPDRQHVGFAVPLGRFADLLPSKEIW